MHSNSLVKSLYYIILIFQLLPCWKNEFKTVIELPVIFASAYINRPSAFIRNQFHTSLRRTFSPSNYNPRESNHPLLAGAGSFIDDFFNKKWKNPKDPKNEKNLTPKSEEDELFELLNEQPW